MGDAPWQTALRYAQDENDAEGAERRVLGTILKPLDLAAPVPGISGKKRGRESVWEGVQVLQVRMTEQGRGGLAATVVMGDIVRIMGGKARVEMCRIVKPKKGRSGDTYALVRFTSPDLAIEAVRAQGKTLSGHPLVLQHTVDPEVASPGEMGHPDSHSSDRDEGGGPSQEAPLLSEEG